MIKAGLIYAGCKFLGICIHDSICCTLLEAQPRQSRRPLLLRRLVAGSKDELLQCK